MANGRNLSSNHSGKKKNDASKDHGLYQPPLWEDFRSIFQKAYLTTGFSVEIEALEPLSKHGTQVCQTASRPWETFAYR